MGGPPATPPLTFNPVAGVYDVDRQGSASFTITATQPVVWNWSSTGSVPTASVANGGTDTFITFSLTNTNKTLDKHSTITVTVGAQTWTITLTAGATGGA